MPVLSTVGGASLRAFGAFRATSASPFIVATGGTVYVDPTDADFKIHQFTTLSDTFVITASPLNATIQVMMVGGGGGGIYGGGGAGGYIYRPSFSIGVGSHSVSVGSGGVFGGNGGNTVFSTLVALGGGGFSKEGGSGGGGVDQNGGAGLQPTSASGGFGNKGANWTSAGNDGGGGGAGAGGAIPSGGVGRIADIINSAGTVQQLAQGGHGNQNSTSFALPAVLANSGNGGWGGGYSGIPFKDGQAGIVRIRYKFQ
jgi:hypothetical protein